MEPLRPALYKRLVDRFGDVAIAREGEEMIANALPDLGVTDKQGRPVLRLTVSQPGEAYRICCPHCSDTRKRLWINHLWAYKDKPENGKKPVSYMWLIRCFNDDCMALPGRKAEFYKSVYDDVGYGQHFGEDIVKKGRLIPRELKKAAPPGLMMPLVQLPLNHPANAYLASRGYDPRYYADFYRLTFCTEVYENMKQYAAMIEGRIIIPVYMRGELVGWQARCLGEPVDKWCPKYFTMPGMFKSSCLYNFDTATRYPYVVVTEGVTSAWRYGPEAVGLFGKDCSSAQAQSLVSCWKTVVCLLDADAADKNQELHDSVVGGGPEAVVRVDLPPGTDPGSYSTSNLRHLVAAAASQQGVVLHEKESVHGEEEKEG